MIVRFRTHAFLAPGADPAGLAIAKKRGIDSVILPYEWNNGKSSITTDAIDGFTPRRPFLMHSLLWKQTSGRDANFSPNDTTTHIKWLLTQVVHSELATNADMCFFVENGHQLRNSAQTMAIWRDIAQQVGLPITICNVVEQETSNPTSATSGFDWTIRRTATFAEATDPFELHAEPFGQTPDAWSTHLGKQIEDGIVTCLRNNRPFLPIVVDHWSAASAKHSEHLAGILQGVALAPADQGVYPDGSQATPPSALYSRL